MTLKTCPQSYISWTMLRCAKSDTRHDNQLTTFCVQYVAYHDIIRRDLYVSSDEGKNWQRVADIPQGNTALFIEHPFNNRMVSISSTYPPICSAVPRLLFGCGCARFDDGKTAFLRYLNSHLTCSWPWSP